MPNVTRSARRGLLAAFAAASLVISISAAAPAPAAPTAAADILWYRRTFYSDATRTTIVGAADGYCDGDYIVWHGYQTSDSPIRYYTMCP
ncbi:MAG TPA: hypothetical protein VFQ76_10755 [Longimicrobiaceae bacterium]|nr:hypothetical protein [Longimicrobiaceae bacterium]